MTTKPDMHQSVESIAGLLGTSGQYSLRVPDYQRSYSWSKRQYGEFWDDVVDFTFENETNANTYFLGAVVFVGRDDPNDGLEILDGQQRLTTATILLMSLANFLRSESDADYADDVTSLYVARRERGGRETMYKLVLNSHDESFFRQLVQEQDDGVKPVTRSHKNILACKRFFDAQLRAWKRNDEEGAADRARKLADTLLDKVFVCSITANNLNAAGFVFERLNDRGIGLTPVDLVRSLVMQRCTDQDREVILDDWRKIFQVEGRGSVDDMLRFHWVTRQGDATSDALYKLIKARFKKKEPGYNPVGFTRDLQRAAGVYNGIYSATERKDAYTDVAAYVVELNAKPMIPLLMKCNGFEPVLRDRLATTAFTAFIRNRVIANQSSTSFEDEVYVIARDVKRDEASVTDACNKLRQYMLDDDDFARAFEIRSLNVQKTAKLILRLMESHLQRERAGGNVELVVGSNSLVDLEHIYPRKPEAEHEWPEGQDWLNRVGNLTLLAAGLNREAQNGPFEDKKAEYSQSQLFLTRELLDIDEWSPEKVVARQKRMAQLALKVWPKEA